MGRRSEQRIAVSISVIARGSDSRGSSFVVDAEVIGISVSGAGLLWPIGVAASGAKIEIEYRGKKAWFQIRWMGSPRADGRRHIGVKCVEPGKYIWDLPPKQWEPDTYEPYSHHAATRGIPLVSPEAPSWPGGKERRQFPRMLCAIEAQLMADGYSVGIPVKIADISLGGCYIEMFSPLPKNSLLELTLKMNNNTLHVSGKVRSSQTGFGMGIAFTSMSPEDFETLKKFAPPTLNIPQSIKVTPLPPPQNAASDSAAGQEFHLENRSIAPDVLEAVVRLLCRKGLVTPAEVSEEIERLKVQKV
jgi:hypothetical protein